VARISLRRAAMSGLQWGCGLGLVLTFGAIGAARAKTITPALSRVNDGTRWSVINADASLAVESGRSVVRLWPKGGDLGTGSNVGLALVEGVDFAEGTVEVDLKGRGGSAASFLGLAFAVADGKTFEAVYFRPFRFRSDDVASRVHAIQYVAWPEHTWRSCAGRSTAPTNRRSSPSPTRADGFTPASR
jgi:hypothetical protein